MRTIASRDGLFASFMPKPLYGESGNGLHFDISVFKNGADKALFMGPEIEGAISGIMSHIEEMTLFFNTTTNSYHRLGSFAAPRFVSWGGGNNRSQLLLAKRARDGSARLLLRSPDPLCSPYFAYALLIEAAMEGILSKSRPEAPSDFDISRAPAEILSRYRRLPESLGDAVEAARNSAFLRSRIPQAVIDKMLEYKSAEWEAYLRAEDRAQFEMSSYFEAL